MKILPPILQPPNVPLKHRHTPSLTVGRYGYRSYRACVRWDFGFVCPFCLLHESDFVTVGAERTGITTIEHQIPASDDIRSINRYTNCLYCCRFCNRARSDTPVTQAESTLLNPSQVPWSAYFVIKNDEIVVRDSNNDATFTLATYDLNDPTKKERRKLRRELINDRLALLEKGPAHEAELLRIAAEILENQPSEAQHLIDTASLLRSRMHIARRDLSRYLAVPVDAPTACRCKTDRILSIPEVFEVQLKDV